MRAMQRLRIFILSFLLLPLCVLAADEPVLLGCWEGTLVMGREDMTLAFTFARNGEALTAAFTSSAMGIFGMPADTVRVDAKRVIVRIARLDMEFNGSLRYADDGSTVLRIDGDYFQQSEMVPIVLLPVDAPGL